MLLFKDQVSKNSITNFLAHSVIPDTKTLFKSKNLGMIIILKPKQVLDLGHRSSSRSGRVLRAKK